MRRELVVCNCCGKLIRPRTAALHRLKGFIFSIPFHLFLISFLPSFLNLFPNSAKKGFDSRDGSFHGNPTSASANPRPYSIGKTNSKVYFFLKLFSANVMK